MSFASVLKTANDSEYRSAATLSRFASTLFATVLSVLTCHSRVHAYTPEDPVVVQMVDRGIKYLETASARTPGETVLAAYAHYKVERDETNPLVRQGIKLAQDFAAEVARGQQNKSNYESAVSIMLLTEISKNRFRNELATFQRYYSEVQKPHGGFGYSSEQVGDVSQTQYAILALWTLDRSGFKLDYNRASQAIRWLLSVQDVNGPWPYRGKVPTQPGLIAQSQTSISMAFAGAASLLIGGDALRLWGDTASDEETGIVGLPQAVKIYKEERNVSSRKKAKIPTEPLMRAISMMERWQANNPLGVKPGAKTTPYWYYYTIYTIERYESFLEIARGKPADKSPAWYNQYVGELMNMQDEEGGWTNDHHSSPVPDTAFAVLFLIRSTQKSLGTEASATTIGGTGFGDDVSKAQLVGGKAVTKSPAKSVAGMLDLLESDGADELNGKAMADQAVLPTDPVERSAQLDRLERLVRGSKSWQARRVSARLLGTSDDLRVVPALIYALSDPDDSVRRYARDGLRFISRKFEGFGMPDEPNNSELRQAQRKWREWYLTMKPGYVFLDDI